jgi:hypothetical protein
VQSTIADCEKYLSRFEITKARIFPVSAQLAKLIRKSQAGCNLTTKEKNFLSTRGNFISTKDLHFSDYVSLSPSCKKKQEEILRNAETANDEDTQALVYSGIVALELAMDEYLEKYAFPAKISDAVRVFKSIADRLDLKNKEEKSLAENEDARKKVEANLKDLRGKIENGSEAWNLKEKFYHDISIMMNKLEAGFKKCETTINKQIDEEREHYSGDDISPAQAKNIISKTQENMQLQYKILASDLNRLFEKELKEQAQNYLAKYKQYISDLIKTEDYTLSATLNLINVAIPDSVDDLLSRFLGTKTVTETVRRSAGNPAKAWWKFWTWLDEKYREWDEKVQHEEKIVKMESVFEGSIEPQFQQFFSMINGAKKIAHDNAKGLHDFFANEIKRLNQVMIETVQKEEESLKSQDSIKQKIKENKAKIDWLSQFIKELEKVLEV